MSHIGGTDGFAPLRTARSGLFTGSDRAFFLSKKNLEKIVAVVGTWNAG
jgi:hypothetical protein